VGTVAGADDVPSSQFDSVRDIATAPGGTVYYSAQGDAAVNAVTLTGAYR